MRSKSLLRRAARVFAGLFFCLCVHSVFSQTVGSQAGMTTQVVAALSPFIDVHSHMDHINSERSVEAALNAMRSENAAKIIFLPSPWTPEDKDRFDFEFFLAAVKKHPDKLSFLGGGGSLNIMILQAVRSADAGTEVQRRFRERAEEILRQGAIGFGEITTEHLPSAASPSYRIIRSCCCWRILPRNTTSPLISTWKPFLKPCRCPRDSNHRPIPRNCERTSTPLNASYCTTREPRSFGLMREPPTTQVIAHPLFADSCLELTLICIWRSRWIR